MTVVLNGPGVGGLSEAVDALREWQYDGAPAQLHPGDVGWFWRFGAATTAAAVRTWSRNGQVVAVGLLDNPTLLRLAISPDHQQDEPLARQLAADLIDPERGVLPPGAAYLEAPVDALVRDLLREGGWHPDEPWTPLCRDLTEPLADPGAEHPGVRIEVVDAERAHVRSAVQRAAFDRSTFTEERWHTMASGPLYADARCLVAYDDQGNAVGTVTVWSAGPGRRGLVEPMGVHQDHRRHGYGRAVTCAAAAMLRELGSSSAVVFTPSANVGAVTTYTSAGFRRLPEATDLRRDA